MEVIDVIAADVRMVCESYHYPHKHVLVAVITDKKRVFF